MASNNDKHPKSAPGKFYVDNTCITCGESYLGCPEFFKVCEETSSAYVHRQPQTDAEIKKFRKAMEMCPVEAIGDDG
jgi:ferredoxin